MLSEGSTIRLSLRPWLLSPNSGCGEGGARVTSLVVLITSLFWLCLYQSPRLGGTAHSFSGFSYISWLILIDKIHCHISDSGAYDNRQPSLIVSGRQDQ